MRVGYFGTWERGYPRNDQVISSLRRQGVDVEELHQSLGVGEHKFALGPAVLPRLLMAEAKLTVRRIRDIDFLLVGYPGQLDMWAAKRHRLPVAFNAMVSLYDTFVEDRGRFKPGSAGARMMLQIDRRAFGAADLLVADTAANAAYMADLAGLDSVEHVYVGAEESVFPRSWQRPENFNVLFVGKLIPLHGLQVVLDAARLLAEIPFRIVGDGQQRHLLHDLPANVAHTPWVAYRDLAAEYANAGCALGIFGSSAKTGRVIPNKAFQALAVGAPLVTADTPAARELLTDGRDALLVDRDPEALAAAIRRLAGNHELVERMAAAGRDTFEREASEAVLGRRWTDLLAHLAA